MSDSLYAENLKRWLDDMPLALMVALQSEMTVYGPETKRACEEWAAANNVPRFLIGSRFDQRPHYVAAPAWAHAMGSQVFLTVGCGAKWPAGSEQSAGFQAMAINDALAHAFAAGRCSPYVVPCEPADEAALSRVRAVLDTMRASGKTFVEVIDDPAAPAYASLAAKNECPQGSGSLSQPQGSGSLSQQGSGSLSSDCSSGSSTDRGSHSGSEGDALLEFFKGRG